SWTCTLVWYRGNLDRSGSTCLEQARPSQPTWPASLSRHSKNSVGLRFGGHGARPLLNGKSRPRSGT
ncbi:hypothetical protein BGZ52_004066, partial [Haplosporangium bisporale]